MDLSSFGLLGKKEKTHFENVYNLNCFVVVKLFQNDLLKVAFVI